MNVKAYAAAAAKKPLAPFSFTRREPGKHELLIDIAYCGVCHSDIHQVRDEWGRGIFPMVPGHEIVGRVAAVGSEVKGFKPGDFAGVGCFVDSCRVCGSCHEGLEQYCENGMTATYNGKDKSGQPTFGGYSTQIVVDENYTLRISNKIALEKAAPLLCAGITTYSPLKHWQAGPGKRVGVMGLGGLGHMAVKIASRMGAEVTVFSHTDKKRDDAKKFGAAHYVVSSDANQLTPLMRSFDLILNTVSASHELNTFMSLLKRDGTMVLLGIPERPEAVHPFALIGGRRRLAGSLIGGIRETQEMLDFCAQHEMGAEVEVIPIEQINQAYDRVISGDVRYRFVIDINSLRR